MFCSEIPRDHPRKSLLKFYYVKYMGIKSDDTADFGEHVIISYLLWASMAGNITGIIIQTIDDINEKVLDSILPMYACLKERNVSMSEPSTLY